MGNFAENLNLGNRFRPPLQKGAYRITDSCKEGPSKITTNFPVKIEFTHFYGVDP